jgi:hypothetical protein
MTVRHHLLYRRMRLVRGAVRGTRSWSCVAFVADWQCAVAFRPKPTMGSVRGRLDRRRDSHPISYRSSDDQGPRTAVLAGAAER